MGKTNTMSNVDYPHGISEALVAFYLTEETGLPCNTKDYDLAIFRAQDSTGNMVERRGLRVTFKKSTSIKQQCHLLTFGSDDQRCNVILKASEASPVHCKVYAQLNSGPNVWVIEDISNNGTEYLDDEALRNGIPKTAIYRRVAAYGLYRIKIGRNIFSFCLPSDDQERLQRERWFRDLDPMLVTLDLLRDQLRGADQDYCPVCPVGRGGMGAVVKYMEKTTGLMIAVKEEKVLKEGADERIQKEIAYMQSLRHPNLVQYIISNSSTVGGSKKWYTAMPLYQGSLCDILPLQISTVERIMLQLLDGVNYMHGQGVLHKDIKPENILVKGRSGPDIVLADYGVCASLNDRSELMSPYGTLGYAAPEVSRMVVQTPAVDVFALGATLFVILEPENCNGPQVTVATLKNVMRRPPKLYGGLVQSMMAHDPRERPSLKECFEIVKARQRDWKKQAPLALLPSSVPAASGLRRSQRNQKVMVQEPPKLDPAVFAARRPGLAAIAATRRPQIRPRQQEAPGRLNFKAWGQIGRIQEPKAPAPRIAPGPQIAPVRQPQAPAPVQRVDFTIPPPPLPANTFAHRDRDSASNKPPPARRQAAPRLHKPARTPIRKPDSEGKRKIRRGPERRKMVERWHKIRIEKNKLCDGAGEIALRTPLNVLRGLHNMTKAGLGFTGHYLGLIFNDLPVALPALHHALPETEPWGLDTNKRLMYGLKSQGIWPMTPEEYEAERLQSELNFPNTTEGQRAQAKLDAERRERDAAFERKRLAQVRLAIERREAAMRERRELLNAPLRREGVRFL